MDKKLLVSRVIGFVLGWLVLGWFVPGFILCAAPSSGQQLTKQQAKLDQAPVKKVLNGNVQKRVDKEPPKETKVPAQGDALEGSSDKTSLDAGLNTGLKTDRPQPVTRLPSRAQTSDLELRTGLTLDDRVNNLSALARRHSVHMLSAADIRASGYGITGVDIVQSYPRIFAGTFGGTFSGAEPGNLPKTAPALITRVYPETPAAFAGLAPGDQLIAVNDRHIPYPFTAQQIWKTLSGPPGSKLTLTIGREGKLYNVSLTRMNIEDIKYWTSRRYFELLFSMNGAVNR